MRGKFRFFKWSLELKLSKLDADERIGFLANKLIEEIQASNRQVAHPDICHTFGTIDINVHNLNTDDSCLKVKSLAGETPWEIETKPTFKEFYIED